MVVGEPSLMGGEFGDEDERLITRLENQQFDSNNGMDNEEEFEPGSSKRPPSSGGPGSWTSGDVKPPVVTQGQDDKAPSSNSNWITPKLF